MQTFKFLCGKKSTLSNKIKNLFNNNFRWTEGERKERAVAPCQTGVGDEGQHLQFTEAYLERCLRRLAFLQRGRATGIPTAQAPKLDPAGVRRVDGLRRLRSLLLLLTPGLAATFPQTISVLRELHGLRQRVGGQPPGQEKTSVKLPAPRGQPG